MVVRPACTARSISSAGVSRPSDAVVCMWRSITVSVARLRDARARASGSRDRSPGRPPAGAGNGFLFLAQQAVLANQHLEVLPLLFRELQEDLLAFGVLEPLAVALEEP